MGRLTLPRVLTVSEWILYYIDVMLRLCNIAPSSANGGTGPATLIIPSTPTVSEGPSNQTTPPRPQPPATLQHPWSNRPMFIFSAAQGPSTPVRRRVPAVLAPPDENAPPPYSIPPDVNRKITFEVTTSLGDSVMLSAKLCVRLTKTLEAACAILKLDVG